MTRVLIAGGGTGGHLYPGIAIARALVRARPSIEPFFIGARRGVERDVLPTTEFPFALLDLHPLYRPAVWQNWKTARGAATAWRQLGAIVRQERPALVLGTGGYAAGIGLAYAVMHRLPMVQQAGDSLPGLTARAFARWSREIYLNFPEAARVLRARPGALIDTGAPIEPPPDPRPDRAAARAAWSLPPDGGRVLLVFGASQGALAINRALAGWIDRGVPDDLFVIWSTGRGTYDQFKQYESGRVRVRPYIAPMADAYAAADLAVSRASAMSTSELFAWHVPPILIPLPSAAADHQTTNARTLEQAGAALMLVQDELTPERLERTVCGLLDDPAALARLADGAARRARPSAAADIAQRMLALIG